MVCWPHGVLPLSVWASLTLKILGLVCRISSRVWGSFPKETYNGSMVCWPHGVLPLSVWASLTLKILGLVYRISSRV